MLFKLIHSVVLHFRKEHNADFNIYSSLTAPWGIGLWLYSQIWFLDILVISASAYQIQSYRVKQEHECSMNHYDLYNLQCDLYNLV